jgi:AcrR family transcriptional regulator
MNSVGPRNGRRGREQAKVGGAGAGELPVSERRGAILAIAAEMFARKGFAATTVREIADEAGILSGSLYHHFDSKESMIDEIISAFIDEMVTSYRDIIESTGDPLETLQKLIRRAFDALLPNRSALTVAQNESHYLQQFERFAYLQESYAEIERLWTSVLQRGIDAGVFRSDLDTKLVYLFMRDAIWVTVRWYQPGGRYTIDELAETYTAIALDGIRQDEPVAPPKRRRAAAAATR